MSNSKLTSFFDTKVPNNPYGGISPNPALENPGYVENGGVNLWTNNQNWEGSVISEVWANLSLEMLRQTEFMHLRFATGAPIIAPRKAGTARVTYNRLRPLGIVLEPMKEGVIPTRLVGGSEKSSATYSYFGAYMQVTDVEIDQNPDEMFLRYGSDLIRSAHESFDTITREFMYKASSRAFANGCASVDEVIKKGVYFKPFITAETDIWKYKTQRGAQLTISDIREQQLKMKLLKVKPHPSYGKYVVLVGAEGIDQLRNDQEFKSWNMYEDPSMFNNRNYVYMSTDLALYEIENAKRVKSGDKEAGVAFIIGNDAYKEVKLAGNDLQIITKSLDSGGASNPVNQTATMGWKKAFGLVSPRSEALVSLVYAIDDYATKTFGTRIDWGEDGKASVNYANDYTFTELKDGVSFFVSMEDIYDFSEVNPMPYPTDQDSYVKSKAKKDSKLKVNTSVDYIDPGIARLAGSLATQLTPDILDKIKKGEINIVNAINAVAGKSPEQTKQRDKRSLNDKNEENK